MNAPRTPSSSPPVEYDARTGAYYAYHDMASSAKLSTTVVHALADVMGVDVTNTEFTLYDAVDPDALDDMFAPKPDGTRRLNGLVSFDVEDYEVTVYADGQIVIRTRPNWTGAENRRA